MRGKIFKIFQVSLCGALLAGLTSIASAADVLPRDLGFQGSFAHQGDDSFDFGFQSGWHLNLARNGKVINLGGGGGELLRDKAGKALAVLNLGKPLMKLHYNKEGQLILVTTVQGETFKISYTKSKKLLHIRFPNGQKGLFP